MALAKVLQALKEVQWVLEGGAGVHPKPMD